MGNARWGELVARHHRLIRRALRRYGGQEIDTAGDGFFATFERPVDAIRCAVAAADAVRELGIEIRAGVSFGELETVGSKPGGLVVNTAARVMSVAGPGEVLVPAAVKDLMPGAGIAFADHGVHQLKGLEDELRLFRVEAVGRHGRRAAARGGGRPSAAPRSRRRARRGRSWAVIAGIAAATVVAAAIWLLSSDDDPRSRPQAATAASRASWSWIRRRARSSSTIDFTDAGRPRIHRSDLRARGGRGRGLGGGTGQLRRVGVPCGSRARRGGAGPLAFESGAYFVSMVPAFDALWATTDQLIRVNPATDEARSVLAIPPPTSLGGASVAADRRNLWLASPGGTLLKLDPDGRGDRSTGRVERGSSSSRSARAGSGSSIRPAPRDADRSVDAPVGRADPPIGEPRRDRGARRLRVDPRLRDRRADADLDRLGSRDRAADRSPRIRRRWPPAPGRSGSPTKTERHPCRSRDDDAVGVRARRRGALKRSPWTTRGRASGSTSGEN